MDNYGSNCRRQYHRRKDLSSLGTKTKRLGSFVWILVIYHLTHEAQNPPEAIQVL